MTTSSLPAAWMTTLHDLRPAGLPMGEVHPIDVDPVLAELHPLITVRLGWEILLAHKRSRTPHAICAGPRKGCGRCLLTIAYVWCASHGRRAWRVVTLGLRTLVRTLGCSEQQTAYSGLSLIELLILSQTAL